MTVTKLIAALTKFPDDKEVLIWNGETLCVLETVAECTAEDDPDEGSVVLYPEE